MKIEIDMEMKIGNDIDMNQNGNNNNNNNNPLIPFALNRVLMIGNKEIIEQNRKERLLRTKNRVSWPSLSLFMIFNIQENQCFSLITGDIEGISAGMLTENNNNNNLKYPLHRNGLSGSRVPVAGGRRPMTD